MKRGEEEVEMGPTMPERKRAKSAAIHEDAAALSALPSGAMYEQSFMHRDVVTHVAVAGDFVATASRDGHVKLWRKRAPHGIEFVKHFRAHTGAVACIAASADGRSLASAGAADRALKLYDVRAFDMADMHALPFAPLAACFAARDGALLALSDAESGAVHVYDVRGTPTPLLALDTLHRRPVQLLRYNARADVVVSADAGGAVEYWTPATGAFPPADRVAFRLKLDTDLYALARARTHATALEFSADGAMFAVVGADRKVRVFEFATGKLLRVFDESLELWEQQQQQQQTGGGEEERKTTKFSLDPLDFGRRLAVEREIEARKDRVGACPQWNALFDESGRLLIYATPLGIKVISLARNRVVRLLGKVENSTRFLSLALFQGTASEADSTASAAGKAVEPDPTLFCTAHGKQRFYMFTKREPQEPDEANLAATGRDVFNERPIEETKGPAVPALPSARLARSAVMHTTKGDIFMRLFPDECPKTVENFTVHSRNGYYNGLLFHRVIKGFMIQTGDPRGDGTGGESIWGHDFEDEFSRSLRHDRPFTVSMANAGPDTNGSQFFISTVPLPRLDGKHTVFGRVYRGQEVVTAIENVRTRKGDHPAEDIKILSIDVSSDAPSAEQETPASK